MRRGLLAIGLISTLAVSAYSGTFNSSFHFDDYHQILNNPGIRSMANVPGFFLSGDVASYVPGLKGYRPINMSSFALNYAVSGYKVWSYHLFNLVLHICNAFMVYLIASRLIGGAALPASLLFALHPVQTNAVTYISGRSAVLSSFFCLLGIWLFMRYRSAENAGARAGLGISTLAAFVLGLLSKEAAVVMIGLMLAYDLVYTAPVRGGVAKSLKAGWIYLPFLAVLAFYVIIRKSTMGYTAGVETGYGRWEYMVSEAKVLLLYVRLLLLPTNQNADYVLPLAKSLDLEAGLAFVMVAAALYMLLKMRRDKPALAFFGLWFFIAWAPESTLVPITDTAVEYRMYMPSVGFIVFVTALADMAIGLPSVKRWAIVAIAVVLAVLSFNRNEVWATEYSLWNDVARKSPRSARAYLNLGLAMVQQGRYPEASKEFETALSVDPGYGQRDSVYTNLGLCLMKMGEGREALKLFERAVRMNPAHQEAFYYMGLAYYDMRKYAESAEALQKALAIDGRYADAHSGLGQTYTMLGRYEDAVRESEEAVRYDPRDFAVNYNLAVAYYNVGMRKKAMESAVSTLALAGTETEKRGAEALIENVRQGLDKPRPQGK